MAHDLVIPSHIPHIAVKGGKAFKSQRFSANFFMLKLAKQGTLIQHFFTIFKPNYAHDGQK